MNRKTQSGAHKQRNSQVRTKCPAAARLAISIAEKPLPHEMFQSRRQAVIASDPPFLHLLRPIRTPVILHVQSRSRQIRTSAHHREPPARQPLGARRQRFPHPLVAHRRALLTVVHFPRESKTARSTSAAKIGTGMAMPLGGRDVQAGPATRLGAFPGTLTPSAQNCRNLRA
ncbi:hypothetical protein GSI_12927 [Ganoderma sinense ZZ0214-1]|uniref:Uncharacterized protein n=1 Tax=Ganoderma sinense ZZ0214-1 TaxID=1077348 RepID=A0A2G8RU63_9APHY|nr:hypothetical protein GSI_12927 [Ganoderma sinense ZZ0214-1]